MSPSRDHRDLGRALAELLLLAFAAGLLGAALLALASAPLVLVLLARLG